MISPRLQFPSLKEQVKALHEQAYGHKDRSAEELLRVAREAVLSGCHEKALRILQSAETGRVVGS